MVAIVPGVERLIGGVTQYRWTNEVTRIELTKQERSYLRFGLRDVSAAAEAIVHAPSPTNDRPRWGRREVVDRIRVTVLLLGDSLGRPLHVTSILQSLVLKHAIEANDYFPMMADNDPRLIGPAISAADALCRKLAAALGIDIGPVPIGRDRRRFRAVDATTGI